MSAVSAAAMPLPVRRKSRRLTPCRLAARALMSFSRASYSFCCGDCGGGKRHRGDDGKSEQKKPQVDEKAYKAALDKIPEPKEKYDPWGAARPADPKKTK